MCVGFWRVYEATVRSNGAGSVRGEVECRWVRGVMEVGERSNGVRTVIFFIEMRVERGKMRWYSLGREDWRDESREERRQTLEKADQWVWAQSKLSSIFITVMPSKSSVHCLKSQPSMFQKIYFKQGFLSNHFQTTLF